MSNTPPQKAGVRIAEPSRGIRLVRIWEFLTAFQPGEGSIFAGKSGGSEALSAHKKGTARVPYQGGYLGLSIWKF